MVWVSNEVPDLLSIVHISGNEVGRKCLVHSVPLYPHLITFMTCLGPSNKGRVL